MQSSPPPIVITPAAGQPVASFPDGSTYEINKRMESDIKHALALLNPPPPSYPTRDSSSTAAASGSGSSSGDVGGVLGHVFLTPPGLPQLPFSTRIFPSHRVIFHPHAPIPDLTYELPEEVTNEVRLILLRRATCILAAANRVDFTKTFDVPMTIPEDAMWRLGKDYPPIPSKDVLINPIRRFANSVSELERSYGLGTLKIARLDYWLDDGVRRNDFNDAGWNFEHAIEYTHSPSYVPVLRLVPATEGDPTLPDDHPTQVSLRLTPSPTSDNDRHSPGQFDLPSSPPFEPTHSTYNKTYVRLPGNDEFQLPLAIMAGTNPPSPDVDEDYVDASESLPGLVASYNSSEAGDQDDSTEIQPLLPPEPQQEWRGQRLGVTIEDYHSSSSSSPSSTPSPSLSPRPASPIQPEEMDPFQDQQENIPPNGEEHDVDCESCLEEKVRAHLADRRSHGLLQALIDVLTQAHRTLDSARNREGADAWRITHLEAQVRELHADNQALEARVHHQDVHIGMMENRIQSSTPA